MLVDKHSNGVCMKINFKHLTCALLASFWLPLFAACLEPINRPLNLVMVFSSFPDKTMTEMIDCAVRSDFQCKFGILANCALILESRELKKYYDLWRFYVSDDHMLILCLPKYEVRSLQDLGFKENYWKLFPYDQLEDHVILCCTADWSNHLNSMLSDDSSIEKYVALWGHGRQGSLIVNNGVACVENARIAGMEGQDYKKLLERFNKWNVKALYLKSCYSGGLNMHIYDEILTGLQFFIITSSCGDVTVSFEPFLQISHNQMFRALDALAASGNPNLLVDWLSRPYRGWDGKLVIKNLPMIFTPGAARFKCLKLGNEIIVDEENESNDLVVDQHNDAVLFTHPSFEHAILIKSDIACPIVSKVAGPVVHLIHSIEALSCNFFNVINAFIPNTWNRDCPGTMYKTQKVWVIPEIVSKDQTVNDVILFSTFYTKKDGCEELDYCADMVIYKSLEGNYFQNMFEGKLSTQISQDQYLKLLQFIMNKVKGIDCSSAFEKLGYSNQDPANSSLVSIFWGHDFMTKLNLLVHDGKFTPEEYLDKRAWDIQFADDEVSNLMKEIVKARPSQGLYVAELLQELFLIMPIDVTLCVVKFLKAKQIIGDDLIDDVIATVLPHFSPDDQRKINDAVAEITNRRDGKVIVNRLSRRINSDGNSL